MFSNRRPRPAHRTGFVRRYLDPADRLGEVLFGIIMTLTFTLGAGLIVGEGREATREMLVGIIGCNVAWGLIDGAMYVLACLFDRSRRARLHHAVREAGDPEAALAAIGEEFDDDLEPFTTGEERERLYRAVLSRLESLPVERTRLRREDVYGAIASFWLVFAASIPAVLPFLLLGDRFTALRVSNGLLLALLFLIGHRWGRVTHGRPWALGTVLLLAGVALVGIAIALGG